MPTKHLFTGEQIREQFLLLLKNPWFLAVIAVSLGGVIWYSLITKIDSRDIEEARFEF